MRLAALATFLALVAGCSHRDTVGESWAQYYPWPEEETTSTPVDRQEILLLEREPSGWRRIGYLEKYEIVLQGTRTRSEFYYVLDRRGLERLGFATERGEFFRFNPDGTKRSLGAYPVFDVGLKVFFDLSQKKILRLDAIDPYQE